MFLERLACLVNDCNPAAIMDWVIQNRDCRLPEQIICDFMNDLSLTQSNYHDLHLSGQGGSGFVTPNMTSLTAFYLAKCGYDVAKTGSSGSISNRGSTEFFARMQAKYPSRFIGLSLKYYDIGVTMPWFRYRTILALHPDFNHFMETRLYDELHCNDKYTGIRGPEAYYQRRKKQHTIPTLSDNTFYTSFGNVACDEILFAGTACLNEHVVHTDSIKVIPRGLSAQQIDEINEKLLLGLDFSSFWYRSLELSVSSIIMCHSRWTITRNEALRRFQAAYG